MIYASRNPFRLASASRNKAASSDVVHEEEGVTGAVNKEHGLVVLVMLLRTVAVDGNDESEGGSCCLSDS